MPLKLLSLSVLQQNREGEGEEEKKREGGRNGAVLRLVISVSLCLLASLFFCCCLKNLCFVF